MKQIDGFILRINPTPELNSNFVKKDQKEFTLTTIYFAFVFDRPKLLT
jgi:hypothetical protein